MRKSAAVLPALALVLALGVDASAQDKPAPDPEAKPAPEAEVEPVRGVRYRVWMKSGRSMEGVVRAKGVFERLSAGGYRSANDDEKGAGVRFWFPQAQDGFIFMPVTAIQRLEELGELSADEGRSIARATVQAAHRAKRERFEIKSRRAAEEAAATAAAEAEAEDAEGAGVDAEAGADEGAETLPEQDAEAPTEDASAADAGAMAALLLKYPPSRWTLESPQEIERRKVILGLFPSDEEKAFLAVFDEWKVAYAAWAKASEADAGSDGTEEGDEDDAAGRSTARER